MTHYKVKYYPSIICTSQYQQRKLRDLQKIEYRFDEGYDSDGGPPGPFFDMEYIEDTQCSDEDALHDVVPLDAGKNPSSDEGNRYVAEGGDNQNID